MTNYQFFEAVVNSDLSLEVRDHAREQMQKLDQEKERAAKKRHEKADQNLPLKNKIHAYLTKMGAKCASDLADAMTLEMGEKVSTSKVSAMCKQMETAGLVTVEKKKSPTSSSKVNWYTAVQVEGLAVNETIVVSTALTEQETEEAVAEVEADGAVDAIMDIINE